MPRDMIELIRRLSPLRLGPNCVAADESIDVLGEELPFDVVEVPGGHEVNGWIVPRSWEVEHATIPAASGKVVYDGLPPPPAVIGYSRSFQGRVDLATLRDHLFFPTAFDDALVYHCDLFYKPFREEW